MANFESTEKTPLLNHKGNGNRDCFQRISDNAKKVGNAIKDNPSTVMRIATLITFISAATALCLKEELNPGNSIGDSHHITALDGLMKNKQARIDAQRAEICIRTNKEVRELLEHVLQDERGPEIITEGLKLYQLDYKTSQRVKKFLLKYDQQEVSSSTNTTDLQELGYDCKHDPSSWRRRDWINYL